MKTISSIEPLEARIAPAMLLSPTELRYVDVDGDVVRIKFSKGQLDLQENFTFAPAGRGEQLQRIALGAEFSDADLTISVTRTVGDGFSNIGHLDATGVDLGVVRTAGDLGRIDAGDTDLNTAGLDYLRVQSMGRFGVITQPPGDGSLASNVAGDFETLRVRGAMIDASLSVTGSIGSIFILGSLRGGVADDSGSILSTRGIGLIQIERNIAAGSGRGSGGVLSEEGLGTLIVGGSIESGSIRTSGKIDSIFVGGSLVGTSEHPVLVSAGGLAQPGADATTIGRLRVVGDVVFSNVMAGYNPAAEPVNGDAQIGRIIVDGNWLASTAAAGVLPGTDGLFGTVDDTIQFPHVSSIIASIAVIKIGGTARGTMVSKGDHFGFVAEQIGEVVIGNRFSQLSPGPSNDDDFTDPRLALGTTGDLRIVEVSSLAPPPNLFAAVSRKIHGAAGAFDINLLSGTTGIESRIGDTLNLVFTFDHDLSGGTAAVVTGFGTVLGSPIFNTNQMTVNIGGVTDVQTLVIQLSSIVDTVGGVLDSVSIPVAILRADVNGSRAVDISDVNTVRAATNPGTVTATNFRTDVDLSGFVDAADKTTTQGSSGNRLN